MTATESMNYSDMSDSDLIAAMREYLGSSSGRGHDARLLTRETERRWPALRTAREAVDAAYQRDRLAAGRPVEVDPFEELAFDADICSAETDAALAEQRRVEADVFGW